MGPATTARADELEQLGRRSDNPVLQDFAVLSAQYLRAFVLALPTYTGSDGYVGNASTYLALVVDSGCQTVNHG